MLNKIIIMGRLTRDPDISVTQTGARMAKFTLAVDRDFPNKDTGAKETDFIDVTAWRSTAEFVSKYFSKGRTAVVEGRLQIRNWEDKEGNKRKNAEVVANSVYFGDSKKESYGHPADVTYSEPTHPAAPVQPVELTDDDGELPF